MQKMCWNMFVYFKYLGRTNQPPNYPSVWNTVRNRTQWAGQEIPISYGTHYFIPTITKSHLSQLNSVHPFPIYFT